MNPILIIAIALIGLIIIAKTFKKKEYIEVNQNENTLDDLVSDELLFNLQVYRDGKALVKQKSITVTGKTEFSVRGFDRDGREVALNPSEVFWKSSCPVVKFAKTYGLENEIWCSVKSEKIARNIYVKYTGGITFGWKMVFI